MPPCEMLMATSWPSPPVLRTWWGWRVAGGQALGLGGSHWAQWIKRGDGLARGEQWCCLLGGGRRHDRTHSEPRTAWGVGLALLQEG